MSNSVSKNTRWCGEAELLGTDGDSYQEGSWSTPGKERMRLSVINTVRSGRFSPGGTLQDDEFWGRTQSDNTLRVPCWNETLMAPADNQRGWAQNRHMGLEISWGWGGRICKQDFPGTSLTCSENIIMKLNNGYLAAFMETF